MKKEKNRKLTRLFAAALSFVILTAAVWAAAERDLNGDKIINREDAQILLDYSVDVFRKGTEAAAECDLDGDGEITPEDARLLLRSAVFGEKELPEIKTTVPETTEKPTEATTKEETTAEETTTEETTTEETTTEETTTEETTTEETTTEETTTEETTTEETTTEEETTEEETTTEEIAEEYGYDPIEDYSDYIEKNTLKKPEFEFTNRRDAVLSDVKMLTEYYSLGNGRYSRNDIGRNGKAVLTLTGDLMCQTRQQTAAFAKYGEYRFNESFLFVRDILNASDLTIGNLEANVCSRAPYMSEMKTESGKPYLNAPTTFLDALGGAGFDVLVTANNHDLDAGLYGMFKTLERLDDYNFIHTGTFTPLRQPRYVLVNVNGINVAVMSYAGYFNLKDANITQQAQSICLNRYSYEAAQRDILSAKAAGADFVIVYFHSGNEYMQTPNETQIQTAQELADLGADYVAISHSHCLQPYDILTSADGRSVPVIYSMGNFISHQEDLITMETIILRLELEKTDEGVSLRDSYIPCRVLKTYNGMNYVIMPVPVIYNGGLMLTSLSEAGADIAAVIGDKLMPAENADRMLLSAPKGLNTLLFGLAG